MNVNKNNYRLLVHGKKDHWDNALDSQSQFASGSQVDFADSQAFGSQQPYYQNHGISQAPEVAFASLLKLH